MDIFDILTMVGGLSLFLFGMNLMGSALERRAGDGLRSLLAKLTSKRILGFLTGMAVTAVIQSSSATTVMVVGFVNSGLLTLGQAINVIMGANVGTTITAWILSLGDIESGNVFVQLLKPTSFTPILALVGIIYFMFLKDSKKKDTGLILLGFATLMFGMDTMSDAVQGLKDISWFQQLFIMFENPILGVMAGAVLTAVLQSSSASVGILQALSITGQITYAAAIPIIMGQNIGTCITAILSSVGTTKNAKRAAFVHLLFNVLGTVICLIIFSLVELFLAPAILSDATNRVGISVCHTMFNLACTALLLPSGNLLEKLVVKLVPDEKKPETVAVLDDRLLATPVIALSRCRTLCEEMADCAKTAFHNGTSLVTGYSEDTASLVRNAEDKTDRYEDMLGTYLVKLSGLEISEADRAEAAMLLKAIGDFERISDLTTNILEAAEELNQKQLNLSSSAQKELAVITAAVTEVVELSFRAFLHRDIQAAFLVEPLEEVVDGLKDKMRSNHILRLQQGNCSIETGFIWSDLLTSLERISDHCSNLACGIIDLHHHNRNSHEALRSIRIENPAFDEQFRSYAEKYHL